MKASDAESQSMSETAAEALKALRQAVNKVVDSHRHSGRPMAVWKDGKVEKVIPKAATAVREKPGEHRYGSKDRE